MVFCSAVFSSTPFPSRDISALSSSLPRLSGNRPTWERPTLFIVVAPGCNYKERASDNAVNPTPTRLSSKHPSGPPSPLPHLIRGRLWASLDKQEGSLPSVFSFPLHQIFLSLSLLLPLSFLLFFPLLTRPDADDLRIKHELDGGGRKEKGSGGSKGTYCSYGVRQC